MRPRFGVLGQVLPLAIVMLASATLGFGQTAPPAGAKPFRQSDMTLVVSVRHYLASAERSYYHLYLYSGDGKMVRQLTNVDKMSDVEPVLSPDGKQICFRRYAGNENSDDEANPFYERPSYYHGDQTDTTGTYRLIADLHGGSPDRPVAKAPDWYWPKKRAKVEEATPDNASKTDGDAAKTLRYPSPDGAYEIVIHEYWPQEESDPNGASAVPATFWLTDNRTSTTQRMATMEGFQELSSVGDSYPAFYTANAPYLYEGPLKVAFFSCHLGSTDGNSHFALDLNRKAFTKLSPNGGYPASAPKGVPGFFFLYQERYQDLGYRNKTVNCDYLDFWNEKMERTRFAPNLSKFGGAAVYAPGHGVAVIPPDMYAQ